MRKCVCVISLNVFRYDDLHKVIGVGTQCLNVHFLMNQSVNYADTRKLANHNRSLLHVDDLKGQSSMLKVYHEIKLFLLLIIYWCIIKKKI